MHTFSICPKCGFDPCIPEDSLLLEQRNKAIELYRRPGATLKSVGDEMGMNLNKVHAILRKAGMVCRRPGRPTGSSNFSKEEQEARKEALQAFADEGATLKQSGEALGITKERVRQLYKLYGIERIRQYRKSCHKMNGASA